jgi:hypothetical protein
MSDSFVSVAPDGYGKSVDMDQTATAAGPTIYRQRAVLVGLTNEQIDELLTLSRQQLAVLRAILASTNSVTNTVTEDDFTYAPQGSQ